MACGESDKFKNAFSHKILMRDLEVFRLVCVCRLTDFNEICHNEGDTGWPKTVVLYIFWGRISPNITTATLKVEILQIFR